jgi:hypothetical protein
MLKVKKDLKIRKNNLYVFCDEYELKMLRLDLMTSKIFIDVVFYREGQPLFTKEYYVSDAGDVDVNKLIDDLHTKIKNE